ncbi:MAG: family 10 glycosylhydrolase, partial [Melioribacteraceae bacterium]|nr:family 10 glycosylhydrolase [Melioribacteraceae bacterium]
MIKKYTFLLFFLVLFVQFNFSQSITSKREFRGAWVATVINLDWPSSNSLSTESQKLELIELFDKIEKTNLNAVIFQIRTECDAFYNSSYDPWSYWLTGKQGKAPNPFYDPLEFAIELAHERGMELHAWFNPYRVERQADNYETAANHVTNLHPDWVLRIGNIRFLDPGLPAVREYVTNVVMDVVTRYDVDGVHFDDYFYPYPPDEISTQDLNTYNTYPRGFFDIKDWRRDNINELLRSINSSIKNVKPHVKFGMSPFGIYKNGVPTGISGLDAYNTIYCDPVKWMDEKIIDYLTPQLYWSFGGGQDYGKLLPWWAQQVNGRHLYPGQALYRAGLFEPNEIPRQIRLNRQTDNVYGSILFRAQNLFGNANGVTDSLNNN